MGKDYYTVKEFAQKIGRHQDTVYQRLRRGIIQYRRVTPHSIYEIPKSELKRLKEQLSKVPLQHGMVSESREREHVQPLITKALEEHFAHLTKIARALLLIGDELELDRVTEGGTISHMTLSEQGWRVDEREEVEYIITDRDGIFKSITKERLGFILKQSIQDTCIAFTDTDFDDFFLPHLKAEFPDVESEGLSNVVKENPYKLIEVLRVLVRRGTFNGTCPICKDLQ